MATLTMDDYIRLNDFEGAYKRWQDTSRSWKSRWFNVLKTIYENCTDWAKKYIIDPIKETICKVGEKPLTKVNNLCYWIRLFDEHGILIKNKIGTTTRNIYTRLNEVLADSKEAYSYEIIKVWNCRELPPEGLESELRSKLIKKYSGKNFVKNDRFIINDEFLEPTIEEMENWANAYLAIA